MSKKQQDQCGQNRVNRSWGYRGNEKSGHTGLSGQCEDLGCCPGRHRKYWSIFSRITQTVVLKIQLEELRMETENITGKLIQYYRQEIMVA